MNKSESILNEELSNIVPWERSYDRIRWGAQSVPLYRHRKIQNQLLGMVTNISSLMLAVLVGKLAPTTIAQQCVESKAPVNGTVFRVGVLAIRGAESAQASWASTFEHYLSRSVGKRLDSPITFEMVPVSPADGPLDVFSDKNNVDFVYANPTIASCLESEKGITMMITNKNRVSVNTEQVELTQFGGLVIARAERDDIQTILDINGKRVACVSMEGLGAAQMQFREMLEAGIHHVNDPKQLIFLGNQNKIVNSVLRGETDVGFVRTGQLERTVDDSTGELLDPTLLKIVGQKEDVVSTDGEPFPFKVSTTLYPEWSLAKHPHVTENLALAVSRSMLDMEKHALIAPAFEECLENTGCVLEDPLDAVSTSCSSECFASAVERNSDLRPLCDTTADIALLASKALRDGNNFGWRTALSYMSIRGMQEETGFINIDRSKGPVRCIRSTDIESSFTCPAGHYKRTTEEINNGCQDQGLDCYGFPCLCSPCAEASEVEFFTGTESRKGCSKFSICGSVEQDGSLLFTAVDNVNRDSANFTVAVLTGSKDVQFPMKQKTNSSNEYFHLFEASSVLTGDVVVEIFADGEQITESPFRVQVNAKDCFVETGDSHRVPNVVGVCICAEDTFEIGKRCIQKTTILSTFLIPLSLLAIIFSFCYVQRKRRQADMLWRVQPNELLIRDPPRVLGRGTFGLVLLAEYRGTKVAVKRVLPAIDSSSTIASSPTKPAKKGALPTHADEGVEQYPNEGKPSILGRVSCWIYKRVQAKTGKKSLFDFENIESGAFSLAVNRTSRSQSSNAVLGRMRGESSFTSQRQSKCPQDLHISKHEYRQLQRDFIKEMRLLAQLRHPCITTIMGAILSHGSEPMIVMEFMELGSLYDILHNQSMFFDDDLKISVLRDVAQGTRYLHAANPQVIHGDLKSHNVLLDAKFKAKVADFGLSQKNQFARKVAVGTPYWMAPELLRGESTNTVASDIYAFGILMYEVFSRKDPYEGEDASLVLAKVADSTTSKRPGIPLSCSLEISELMETCLLDSIENRPSAKDIDLCLRQFEAESGLDLQGVNTGLQKERCTTRRTEALLMDIFPKKVAETLRDGRKVEPESFDCVTVLFTDIVGFTKLAGSLPDIKVSSLLDRLYTKLDDLCDVYNVFKVETIGDAFMACTNLASDQPDHVAIMAYFSFAVLEAASETLIDEENPSLGYTKLRVGIHSGPVVGHVIGSKNPRYSLIGDTVNTASRMESHSQAGRIHCSEESASLLNDQSSDLRIISRGNIPMKGKGYVNTFWVRV